VEVVHVGGGCETFPSRIGVGLAELLLRDILCEEFVYGRVNYSVDICASILKPYLRKQGPCPMTSGCCPEQLRARLLLWLQRAQYPDPILSSILGIPCNSLCHSPYHLSSTNDTQLLDLGGLSLSQPLAT
jgi:hypothetical protein